MEHAAVFSDDPERSFPKTPFLPSTLLAFYICLSQIAEIVREVHRTVCEYTGQEAQNICRLYLERLEEGLRPSSSLRDTTFFPTHSSRLEVSPYIFLSIPFNLVSLF